jgi:5,5'-dehydrodivanillate O-demethylase oxygenase subunit
MNENATHMRSMEATRERNERLTRIGPGTPMGNYMRRFWHPIAASVELKVDAEMPVIPVKMLGERLALFRCEDGTLGLVAERCPHRGAALSYGLVEDDCIRCPYHAWKFNKQGQCVDQPAERDASKLKERVQINAYPVQEQGGLIWAYLGPAPAPLLPRYEFVVREDYDHDVGISRMPCNWLQVAENTMDPVHIEYLHMGYTNYVRKRKGLPTVPLRSHKKLAFEIFDYGIIKKRLWEGDSEDSPEWTIGHPQIFPATAQVSYHNGWVQFQIRVPVDDTNTVIYWYNCRPRKRGEPPQKEVPIWENPWANEHGKYMPDQLNAQDMMVMISQGEITDHTLEHLAGSDRGVALYRTTLLQQIERVERGEDPLGVVRDPAKNTPWISLPIEPELSFAFNGVRASAAYDAPEIDLSKNAKRESVD